MTSALPWKTGLELELLAPVGSSRETLAKEIAKSCNGQVRRIFYPQSEFALMQDATVFENLTLGFIVENETGELIAQCVDDLTLVDDLDATKGSLEGWYRVFSDDLRFLSLVEEHCDAAADQLSVLKPLALLYGVELESVSDEPLTRVSDRRGASIAMAASLPGERHRPCELITTPLMHNRDEIINHYLAIAADLSFSVPVEAATHIHFDGENLKSAAVINTLITVFGHYRSDLNKLVGTNPRCRRLGDWPKTVHRLVANEAFACLDWSDAVSKLRDTKMVKYCDFNLTNLLSENSEKNTFEIRILPGSMNAEFITRSVNLFEALLNTCVARKITTSRELPGLMEFIAETGLAKTDQEYWQAKWEARASTGNFGFLRALKRLKE